MKHFDYFAPTEIIFGAGHTTEAGVLAVRYGKKAMLVTVPEFPAVAGLYAKVKKSLSGAGAACVHYDGAISNPIIELITRGAELAKAEGVDVVIGLGGGSSMDIAKTVAVEATHPGTAQDYNCHTAGPTEQTLSILAISTTASTGGQTTPCAVIIKTSTKDKGAIWNKNIFPRVAVVDPEVTPSLPVSVTAQTGLDAFCHNSEVYLSVNTNPLAERMALDAIRIIAAYLLRALADGSDLKTRGQTAWADTLGGLTNASTGVTSSYGLGMQIGGHCPHVTHGQSLAIFYPASIRYTYPAVEHKFVTIGRIFELSLEWESDAMAAERSCDVIDCFPKRIDLWISFRELNVTKEDIREIADCGQVLGNHANNPHVVTIPEMYELFMSCYDRKQGKGGITTEAGILNRDVTVELARMGRTDRPLTADASLTISDNTRVIDPSLAENVPIAVDVFKELSKHFSVEDIILSQVTLDVSLSREREFKARFPPELPCQVVGRPYFRDELIRQVEFAIRAGDFTASSNIILISVGGPRWYCEKS